MTLSTRFDLAGYTVLLSALRSEGYRLRHFDDHGDPSRFDLLLRHDVDYCLSSAAAMGAIERAMGVSSTWFILVRSPLFNPFGADEAEVLQSLRLGGGRIGLQFDASYYGGFVHDLSALEDMAKGEIAALELASAGPVVAVSFHKPPPLLRDYEGCFAGRPHTSEPRFMRDILYCSDTLAKFSFGDPLHHARQTGGCAMQLLTHPIWWSESAMMTGLAKLDALAHRRADHTYGALERSVTAYNRPMAVGQVQGKPE